MVGFWQLVIVLVIVMLVFGTSRLKSVGKDLGGAIKGFKEAVADEDEGKEKTSAASTDQKSDE